MTKQRGLSPCCQPGCPELTRDSYCTEHVADQPGRSGRPMPSNWKRLRARILKRDNHTCHYCSNTATSVDHITPASKGGTDHDTNLVACCWPCNQKKGNRTP